MPLPLRHAWRDRAFFARVENDLAIPDSAAEFAREYPDSLLLVGVAMGRDCSAGINRVLDAKHQPPGHRFEDESLTSHRIGQRPFRQGRTSRKAA